MKHLSKIAVIFTTLFLTCIFMGCSNDASPNDASPNDGNSQNTEVKKILYWDSSLEAFVGTVTWKASNTTEEVLTGFVDCVQWKAQAPEAADGVFHSWAYNVTPEVNTSNYTVTASLKVTPSEFDTDIKRWSDIPNVKVSVILKFTTGAQTTIATQNGYGSFEYSDEEAYPTDCGYYIYDMTDSWSKELNPLRSTYKNSNDYDIGIKIKKAEIYQDDGLLISSATIDWTNENLLKAMSDIDPSSMLWCRVKFEPEIRNIQDNHTVVITTLSGKKITCHR